MIIDAFAASFLSLVQSLETNIKGAEVSNHLTLLQTAMSNLAGESVGSQVLIGQVAKVNKTLNLAVGSVLSLSQEAHHRVLVELVEQFLFMWQLAQNEATAPLAKSILSMGQSAIASVAKGSYSALTMGHGVQVSKTINLSVGHGLQLAGNASVCTDNYCLVTG